MVETLIVNELLSSVVVNGPVVVGVIVGCVWILNPWRSPSTSLSISPTENVALEGEGVNDILSIATLVTGYAIGCVNWFGSALKTSSFEYPFPASLIETSLTAPVFPTVNCKFVVGVP